MDAAKCEIAILVLAHNKAAYTARCLTSLFASTLRPFQVVLVDNGSTDETAAVFANFQARAAAEEIAVSTLRFPQNVGAITGRNRGLALLRGGYLVFLDNDVVVRTRSWLEKLKATLDADPGLGVAAPKLVYPLPPYLIQCAGCAVTPGGQIVFRGRGKSRDDPEYTAPQDCQTLTSAAWMMRTEVAQRAGPLDERFSPVQFEDIDYCYRARELGWRCRYEPAVEMYHFEDVTTNRTSTLNYPYLTVKNGLKFKEKWRHRFSKEAGPPDKEWSWAQIKTVTLAEVPERLETLP